MPRHAHHRRPEQTTTPPHPAPAAPPQLNSPPVMNPHRAAAAAVRASRGALPTFNTALTGNRDFVEGEDFEEVAEGEGESGEDEGDQGEHDDEEEYEDEDEEGEEEAEEEDEEEELPPRIASPLPDNLREISSLASWTVSTHKPGCGVAALRHSSPSYYWQSDGPQPHALTLHFFKLVAVVRIRVYLDFGLDESYTPTKMVFLAGMGGNDLVEFASWEGEAPTGWVNIPLEGVGGRNSYPGEKRRRQRRRNTRKGGDKTTLKGPRGNDSGVYEDYDMDHGNNDDLYDFSDKYNENDEYNDNSNDPTAGNVLKAMVIQMKICENHQNGKDTHVRGFQVFAQDDRLQGVGSGRTRRESTRKFNPEVGNGGHGEGGDVDGQGSNKAGATKIMGIEEADWMGEPEIR